MIDRLVQSWELLASSWRVLLADKELLIFPILSSLALLVLSVGFFVPLVLAGTFEHLLFERAMPGGWLSWLVIFLYYVLQYFIMIFSNSALVAAATIRLEGGDPSLLDGLRGAWAHVGAIAGYALIAATVGLILKALARRRNPLGRLTAAAIGLAWNVATFLVVPALVNDGLGPWAAIKRSASMLRRTWGEQIVGYLSIATILGLAGAAAALVIMVPAVYLGVQVNLAFLIGGVLLLIPIFLALGLLNATLTGIFQAAVYRFATTGDAGHFFQPDLVQHAFRPEA